jgi:hypothetical protein
MKITEVRYHGIEELMPRLQKVTMLTAPDVRVYENARIELKTMDTDQIAPAQRYVLTAEVTKVRDLRWELRDLGYDLFNLNGYLEIFLEGEDEPVNVLPPVVEVSTEANGSVVNILNDGMHRVYLARMERCPIQVIYVHDVPAQYPYYAFPLVNGWNDVEIKEDLPSGYVKKWHRIRNYKSLYRNFNSAFENVGGPRGHFTSGK